MPKQVKKSQAPKDDVEPAEEGDLFVVAEGRSVLVRGDDEFQLLPGEGVVVGSSPHQEKAGKGAPPKEFEPLSVEIVERLLRAGILEPWSPAVSPRAKRSPGPSGLPAMPSEVDAADESALVNSHDKAAAKEANGLAAEARKANRKAPQSHWVIPKDKLKGKNLVQLNAMIRDRDPKAPQFEQEAEAVAFLSQDA